MMIGRLTGRQDEPAMRAPSVQTSAIVCYHCGATTSVSARAMSARCGQCQKSLDIHDLAIKGPHWGGVLCTCGRLTIARKAKVTAKLAVASLGVDILGQFQGIVVSGGTVTIGPRATFRGAVWAPSLQIDEGAVVEGGPFRVPCRPLGVVEISGAGAPKPPPLLSAG